MRSKLSGPGALLAVTLLLSACGGGGGGGGTPPTSTPSPTITATPGGGTGGGGGTGAAFTCPTSATATSVATASYSGSGATTQSRRRHATITPAMLNARSSLLAVTYAASNSQAANAVEGKARGLGAVTNAHPDVRSYERCDACNCRFGCESRNRCGSLEDDAGRDRRLARGAAFRNDHVALPHERSVLQRQ